LLFKIFVKANKEGTVYRRMMMIQYRGLGSRIRAAEKFGYSKIFV
jgi:hypothetical protein